MESECTTTRHIASVRIYVERAMERIKNYQILHVFQIACTIESIMYFLYVLY